MKRIHYVLVVVGYLVLFILFQFACVIKIPRFAPGDEFLACTALMSSGDYQTLLKEVDSLDLSSLPAEQADKIAFMAGTAAMYSKDYEAARRYFEFCRDHYKKLEDHVLYRLSRAYFLGGDAVAAFSTARAPHGDLPGQYLVCRRKRHDRGLPCQNGRLRKGPVGLRCLFIREQEVR